MFREFELALHVFEKMPERDVVTWNSMISSYVSRGYYDFAFALFSEMQTIGVKPSAFTHSIMLSAVPVVLHGRELHGNLIRSGLAMSNLVLGNSLIDMYLKLGFVEYGINVFLEMDEREALSWNLLISGCCKSGHEELSLDWFCSMRSSSYPIDEFSCSSALASCSHSKNLGKGVQIFALCLKLGFLHSSIVSSAVIDLFSKCNRLHDSILVFEEQTQWDSALCNSMISGFSFHGVGEGGAFQIFILSLRQDVRPTEFTLSSILSLVSLVLVDQGLQVHCLVVKFGFELDDVVSSSLVEMYANCGFIGHATRIFNSMIVRDLISWNTMIMGFARVGRNLETLIAFNKLGKLGLTPDRATLFGVLLACSYGGFVSEGKAIFSSMLKLYRVSPSMCHYGCLVDMLARAGLLDEALRTIQTMPYVPHFTIWQSILHGCLAHGDMKLAEKVARMVIDLEPDSSLPYLVLSFLYQIKGQWESMVRIQNAMEFKRSKAKKVTTGFSCVGIERQAHTFRSDQLWHLDGQDVYWVLQLLNWDMEGHAVSS